MRIVAAVTRSGFRRYPRELARSLQKPTRCRALSNPVSSPSLDGIHEHDLAFSWLGHASVLFRQGGMNILADPVFSQRIGLRVGPWTLGPERLSSAPALPEHLPAIDLILITHAHFDHLDKPTLDRLARQQTVVVTARRTRRLIPRGFGAVIEMDWDQQREIQGVNITCIQPQHWGARAGVDRNRGFNSYAIESDDHRVLIAGDTAATDVFANIDPVDVAAFGIGAYDPWEHQHATPEQVWQMFCQMQAGALFPIHHSTFELSDEAVDEPMQRLLAAARDESHRIVESTQGELWSPPRG